MEPEQADEGQADLVNDNLGLGQLNAQNDKQVQVIPGSNAGNQLPVVEVPNSEEEAQDIHEIEAHNIQNYQAQQESESQSSQNLQAQQLQLRMALIHTPDADPVWVERSRNAEATRLWAALFEKGNDQSFLTSIPSHWANFFTVMLTSPELFS